MIHPVTCLRCPPRNGIGRQSRVSQARCQTYFLFASIDYSFCCHLWTLQACNRTLWRLGELTIALHSYVRARTCYVTLGHLSTLPSLRSQASAFGVQIKSWQQRYILTSELGLATSHAGGATKSRHYHSSFLLLQVHVFFLVSRLWARRGLGRFHIPILLHKRVFGLAVLRLWTREVEMLILRVADHHVAVRMLLLKMFPHYLPLHSPNRPSKVLKNKYYYTPVHYVSPVITILSYPTPRNLLILYRAVKKQTNKCKKQQA
jgi:hypothetical protein